MATRPPEKPPEVTPLRISFRDKVMGLQNQSQQVKPVDLIASKQGSQPDEASSGEIIPQAVSHQAGSDGGEAAITPMNATEINGVDSGGTTELVHGEWLNVTRRRRQKPSTKGTKSHDGNGADYSAHNMFAALNLDNVPGQVSSEEGNAVMATQDVERGNDPKLLFRKKRPRVNWPTVPISKLIENAAKASAKFAEKIISKEAQVVSSKPINEPVTKLGRESHPGPNSNGGKSQGLISPIVVPQKHKPRGFNIQTAMNIEVVGPNHLRFLDDVVPTDLNSHAKKDSNLESGGNSITKCQSEPSGSISNDGQFDEEQAEEQQREVSTDVDMG
ncbi:hypothetical protein SESBI_30968 [Sesbania bispinosa]|nr:hypothetical protein SESBI_30968 [Sesbania bispinosa]